MSDPKRIAAPPVPCAVWLTVKFRADINNAARSRFAERLAGFLIRTGIKPVVSTYLIGLHCRAGLVPFEMSLITAWVSGQPEVQALDFLPPIPTLFKKGARHG